jgi:putative sigma-54 modulation protein
MRIEFTGRQTDVPDAIRRLAERKLGKLERLLPGVTRAHVVLSSDKRRQIAEVSLHSRHLDLSAREASADLAGSLVAVVDKLARQAERQMGKRRSRGRTPAERTGRRSAASAPSDDAPAGDRAPVIRRRRLPLKPMTVDEAAHEVLARREGFVVFRDARTERVSVLYRQNDGNLALIEPEA